MNTLFVATHNRGKQKEFAALLSSYAAELKFPQDMAHYEEPLETAETFLENALIKARYGARVSGLPTLADDSGLCVPALNGAPGVYSARYSGQHDDAANRRKLIATIAALPQHQREALFVSVLILVQHEHDPMPLVFQGIWRGILLSEERGHGGFGYDPLFYVPELQQSAAELSLIQKNQLSHRGQALRQLLQFFQSGCR